MDENNTKQIILLQRAHVSASDTQLTAKKSSGVHTDTKDRGDDGNKSTAKAAFLTAPA